MSEKTKKTPKTKEVADITVEKVDQDGVDQSVEAEIDVQAAETKVEDVEAAENIEFDAENMPKIDDAMLEQAKEMMAKLEQADELAAENTDLKSKLGRLAADFEGYRNRTTLEAQEAEAKGTAKAAEALMPVYDDIARALSMGAEDPAKLIPGMEAVQNKVLNIFNGLGLEATGAEGEDFDPQWHEAIQVIAGEEDNKIVQVYELGFRMGEKSIRPARVVVSKNEG